MEKKRKEVSDMSYTYQCIEDFTVEDIYGEEIEVQERSSWTEEADLSLDPATEVALTDGKNLIIATLDQIAEMFTSRIQLGVA